MRKSLVTIIGLGSIALSSHAFAAEGWVLSPNESQVTFGSIKKDTIGEVHHHFYNVTGAVNESGKAIIKIETVSVETWIDVRNERMLKSVFRSALPDAVLMAKVGLAAREKLTPGDTDTIDLNGVLELNGKKIPIETTLFVARLTDGNMVATTDEMIMLNTEDAGIDQDVTELM